MTNQDDGTMSVAAFTDWMRRMEWEIPQAAHVLLKSKQTLSAWIFGSTPIDAHTAHMCQSADVVRFLQSPDTFGNVREMVLGHHAELAKRMAEADAMEIRPRGRPRRSPLHDVHTEPMSPLSHVKTHK